MCVEASGDNGGANTTGRSQSQSGSARLKGGARRAGHDFVPDGLRQGHFGEQLGRSSSRRALASTISGDVLLTMRLNLAGPGWRPKQFFCGVMS